MLFPIVWFCSLWPALGGVSGTLSICHGAADGGFHGKAAGCTGRNQSYNELFHCVLQQ